MNHLRYVGVIITITCRFHDMAVKNACFPPWNLGSLIIPP